jgi:transcriptional regulator with GAF, ATPase, and Fis domain
MSLITQETFTWSQKELQRVRVIGACIKGEMACARAAGLLGLTMHQIKRLKKRVQAQFAGVQDPAWLFAGEVNGNHNL